MFISDANYRDIDSRALVADDFIRVHEAPLYVSPTWEEGVSTMPLNKEHPYEAQGMDIISTHKAIIDDAGNIISVVGKGYNVVQNADIIPDYERAIYRSQLDTTDMKRDIQQSHGGARTVCTYTFPAHTIEVREGDDMQLKISVLNSYDGSWKFMSLVGALRMACMNGQVIGDYFSSFYGKHTRSLDTDVAVEKLEHSLDVYMENAELWKQYPTTAVSELQAHNVFLNLAGESKVLLELLKTTHALYVEEVGNNLWALFNTLTDWSSHAKFKNKSNIASTIITREQKVRKVLPMLDDIRLAA